MDISRGSRERLAERDTCIDCGIPLKVKNAAGRCAVCREIRAARFQWAVRGRGRGCWLASVKRVVLSPPVWAVAVDKEV